MAKKYSLQLDFKDVKRNMIFTYVGSSNPEVAWGKAMAGMEDVKNTSVSPETYYRRVANLLGKNKFIMYKNK